MISSSSFKNIAVLYDRFLSFLRSFITRMRINLHVIQVKDVFRVSLFSKYISEMIRVSFILINSLEFES